MDAGFVYRTDAALVPGVEIAAEWETVRGEPIMYPAGLVADGLRPGAAADFFQFLRSETAARILVQFGFQPYESPEEVAGRL